MNEMPTKFIIETTSRDDAKMHVNAFDMQIAIDSWYNDCLRNKYKHGVMNTGEGLNNDQHKVVDEVFEDLNAHFSELYTD